MLFRKCRPLFTTVFTSVACAFVALPVYADIDRLALINGEGNSSVDPGVQLSKGVLFDGQLVFAGTNKTTGAFSELHGATNDLGAFTIGSLIGGSGDFPLTGVTLIDEFAGSLVISSSSGVNILDPGAIVSDPRVSGPTDGVESAVQDGNYYLRGAFNAANQTDLVVLSGLDGSFEFITENASGCVRSLAPVGNSTVVYIDQNNLLSKVVAPSVTPQLIFGGGLIQPFEFPCTLVSFDGDVFFHAFEPGSNSDQIFVSDGTANGTQRLRGFNTEGNGTGFPDFREFDGKLLFAATDSSAESYGLWSTDGTESGTALLNDIGSVLGGIGLLDGVEYQGNLFFPVDQTLWRTDGTEAGTVEVTVEGSSIDLPPEVSFTEFDEQLYFVAATENSQGIFRIANPGDTPERVSGITQTPVAVNGKLGQQLLVAANNDLFVMPKEPVLEITADTQVAENEGTQKVDVIMTLSEAVPYEVSFSIETVDGTAIAGNDYVQVTRQTQVIPAFTTQAIQEVTLQNDSTQEPSETFLVTVSNLDGARFSDRAVTSGSGSVTITDSDQPVQAGSLQVPATTVGEGGGTATITVITGSNSEVDIEFDFVVAGVTATAGIDFIASSGSGTIVAGSSSTTINIPIIEDASDEANETFTVTVTPTAGLSSGLGVALPPASVTIIDNDDAALDETPPPANDVSSASGGGGGCSIATPSNGDPLFPGLIAMSVGLLFMRRRVTK